MTIEERNTQNLKKLTEIRARLDRQRIIESVPRRNVLIYVVAVEVLAAAIALTIFLN
jgi:hypothetical protein